MAATCGLAAAQIVALARDYGTGKPAAIRVNYGMQRTAGGGNAVRAIACLPALIGAWRDPAGGALLSSSGTYPVATSALERPDLMRGRPRTINMSAIGDALLDAADPPIRAIYVYNSNPVAVAPESARVRAGFAREDLFCVVHEIFQTDTADFADILLPATTQLEQLDVHSSYGHLYALANNPAIAPLGEALPNTEVFRRLAARMGFSEPVLPGQRRRSRAAGVESRRCAGARPRLGCVEGRRLAAPERARRVRAVRARPVSDAVGQVRIREFDAGGAGSGSVARLHRAARVGRVQPGTRADAIRWPSSRRRRATS